MRSWFVRKRPTRTEEVYLYQRYWDGIDKPEYMPVLKLREDEYTITDPNDVDGVKLKSERLKHLTNADSAISGAVCLIRVYHDDIQNLFDFIGANLNHEWAMSFIGTRLGDNHKPVWLFELKSDDKKFLMHFRLVWSDYIEGVFGF